MSTFQHLGMSEVLAEFMAHAYAMLEGKRKGTKEAQQQQSDLLMELREMHRTGEITQEEWNQGASHLAQMSGEGLRELGVRRRVERVTRNVVGVGTVSEPIEVDEYKSYPPVAEAAQVLNTSFHEFSGNASNGDRGSIGSVKTALEVAEDQQDEQRIANETARIRAAVKVQIEKEKERIENASTIALTAVENKTGKRPYDWKKKFLALSKKVGAMKWTEVNRKDAVDVYQQRNYKDQYKYAKVKQYARGPKFGYQKRFTKHYGSYQPYQQGRFKRRRFNGYNNRY